MSKVNWLEGKKYDTGKLRIDLIPAQALEELAAVYTYGANKYADHNWRRGIKWSRVFGAMMRHLWAFWRGEDLDEESGLPHLAHAAFGCFALLEYRRTRRDFDDRYRDDEVTTTPTPPVFYTVNPKFYELQDSCQAPSYTGGLNQQMASDTPMGPTTFTIEGLDKL